jgi:hypothetical protein
MDILKELGLIGELKEREGMYTFWKCYMGFCTPRRTLMDEKKMDISPSFGGTLIT